MIISTYTTPRNTKIIGAVGGFFASIVASILITLIFGHGGLSIAACLGIAITIYLIFNHKLTLQKDGVALKILWNKPVNFLFSQGTFSLGQMTGAKAYFMAMRSCAKVLTYTPHDTGKARTVTYMLSDADAQELFNGIQKQMSTGNLQ